MQKNHNSNPNKVDDLRGKSAEAWMETLWKELLEKLTDLKDEHFKCALEKLISEDEKKMILRRMAVAALVRKGKSYRDIGNILWVSPSNISAIKKNIFQAGHYKSQRSFKTTRQTNSPNKALFKKSWLDELLSGFDGIDLWELIKNPPRPTGMGIKSGNRYYK